MDSDRAAGTAKQLKGSVKEAIGKLTGNTKAQAEGAAEKAEGDLRNAAGDARDTPRNPRSK